jgi:hypothetical protein
MSLQLPRKRTILAWHRWLGLASALFLLSLSITGLALNHTEFVKLDQVQIKSSFILDRYGMASGSEIDAFSIHESDTLAHLDGQLFYNGESLIAGGRPIDIIQSESMSVIATADALIYITNDGTLIEKVQNTQLPYETLQQVGFNGRNEAILIADNGNWIADKDWIDLTSYSGGYSVIPRIETELSQSDQNKLLDNFQGGGVSLYRVLLDLHSGRLFGWGGRTAMDLSAVAIIILITSGIGGWLRKSRRPKNPNL